MDNTHSSSTLICNTTSVNKCHITFYYARCKLLQIHVVYATTLSAILKTKRLCTAEMCSQDVLSLTEQTRRNKLMNGPMRSETHFRRSVVSLDPGGVVSFIMQAVQQSAFTNLLLHQSVVIDEFFSLGIRKNFSLTRQCITLIQEINTI